jgi:hypothetical protein
LHENLVVDATSDKVEHQADAPLTVDALTDTPEYDCGAFELELVCVDVTT